MLAAERAQLACIVRAIAVRECRRRWGREMADVLHGPEQSECEQQEGSTLNPKP